MAETVYGTEDNQAVMSEKVLREKSIDWVWGGGARGITQKLGEEKLERLSRIILPYASRMCPTTAL